MIISKDVRSELEAAAERIIYSGQIDEYFDYCYGPLEYRSLSFETETVPAENGMLQDRAVINFTDADVPWTRIIEHKHFACDKDLPADGDESVITREYPAAWEPGREAFYPVRDDLSLARLEKYLSLASRSNIWFGGRLGSYRYMDMDDAAAAALEDARKLASDKTGK